MDLVTPTIECSSTLGSMYSMPVAGLFRESSGLSAMKSSMFSKLVQAQSTYSVVDYTSNNNLYRKTITVYN